MKAASLFVGVFILSVACLAADETIEIELSATSVDNTALQRRVAVFHSTKTPSQTYRIPLRPAPKPMPEGKNAKNILTLIDQFPVELHLVNIRGYRISKPKGILRFRVPKEDPVSNLDDWELIKITIEEKTEQSTAPVPQKAAQSASSSVR